MLFYEFKSATVLLFFFYKFIKQIIYSHQGLFRQANVDERDTLPELSTRQGGGTFVARLHRRRGQGLPPVARPGGGRGRSHLRRQVCGVLEETPGVLDQVL